MKRHKNYLSHICYKHVGFCIGNNLKIAQGKKSKLVIVPRFQMTSHDVITSLTTIDSTFVVKCLRFYLLCFILLVIIELFFLFLKNLNMR